MKLDYVPQLRFLQNYVIAEFAKNRNKLNRYLVLLQTQIKEIYF